MPADATHGFVATLSDGTTVAEHTGEWTIVEGARKPWVRLCDYLLENKLYITSLRYNINGVTYHAPKLDTRFEKGGIHPKGYSLEYIYEREEGFMPVGVTEFLAVDVGAYYGGPSVHQIVEVGGQKTAWMQVRNEYKPMAPAVAEDIWQQEKEN
jgi:hypothetical protein